MRRQGPQGTLLRTGWNPSAPPLHSMASSAPPFRCLILFLQDSLMFLFLGVHTRRMENLMFVRCWACFQNTDKLSVFCCWTCFGCLRNVMCFVVGRVSGVWERIYCGNKTNIKFFRHPKPVQQHKTCYNPTRPANKTFRGLAGRACPSSKMWLLVKGNIFGEQNILWAERAGPSKFPHTTWRRFLFHAEHLQQFFFKSDLCKVNKCVTISSTIITNSFL